VAVFPERSAHAWAKAHVFVGNARPGHRCLSAVEALDGPGEIAVLAADAGSPQVRRHAWPVEDASCARARGGWDVEAPGLAWRGWPTATLTVKEPRITATATVGPVGWWARIPRVLSYFSAFGEVTWRDGAGESRGTALLEHAWGTDTPLDVAALSPRRWQWDVLRSEDGAVFAGLALHGVGVRTMSLAPGAARVETGWRMRVRAAQWKEEEGRRVPQRWQGRLRTPAGLLRYEASAATPIAPVVPGGGFLGTRWEGTWLGRPVRGTGFTELRA
jgi:hypothetical protein